MPVTINGEKYYRTAEVYRTVGVSRNTLYHLLQRGILGKYELRDRRGWRLFTRDDMDKLLAENSRIARVDRKDK